MKVWLRRRLLVAVAALALPSGVVTAPVLPTSMVAIAHAACPPDCGGGGNSGADSSVPPGAMNGFQPPQTPQLPEYVAGQNYPAPNQNGWTSIYGEQGQQAAPAQQSNPASSEYTLQNPHPWSYDATGHQQPLSQDPPLNRELSQEFKDAQVREAAQLTKEKLPEAREEPPSLSDCLEQRTKLTGRINALAARALALVKRKMQAAPNSPEAGSVRNDIEAFNWGTGDPEVDSYQAAQTDLTYWHTQCSQTGAPPIVIPSILADPNKWLY